MRGGGLHECAPNTIVGTSKSEENVRRLSVTSLQRFSRNANQTKIFNYFNIDYYALRVNTIVNITNSKNFNCNIKLHNHLKMQNFLKLSSLRYLLNAVRMLLVSQMS